MARNQLFNTSHINANNSNLSNSQYLHREQQSLENSTKMVEDYQAMGIYIHIRFTRVIKAISRTV